MLASADTTKLEDALRRGLEGVPHVAACWLFGSQANGRARPDSDIDVGVLLYESASSAPRLAVVRAVLDGLGRELDTERVHLVLLDRTTPPALAWQVLAHGRPIVVNDATQAHRFTVRTYREHGDREHVERFFREATRARALAREPSRG